MSRGIHSKRTTSPSSTYSSSSSSSSTSSRTCISSPDFPSIQKAIRAVFRSSRIIVRQAERLQGILHQVYVAKLADGSSLVIKCPPGPNIHLLRHEKHFLETSHTTLAILHENTQLPVPHILKYDTQSNPLGSPYLMMTHLPGVPLSSLSATLSPRDRHAIDLTLGTHMRALTALTAPQFGLPHRVAARKGCVTWREAFLSLLESLLRDAEDMLVTIPYASIRHYIAASAHCLNDVTVPRLVALDACEAGNVLVCEQTRRVTGLVGWGHVVWGDALMCGGVEGGSEGFREGMRVGGVEGRSEGIRMAIYAAYRASLRIVAHHYRPHQAIDELAARHALSCALNELARV